MESGQGRRKDLPRSDTLYVAATRYKHDDTAPYLYKTADGGRTWTKITDDLPAGEFTRTIRADPARPGLLYCGTETGIYVSFDDGAHWSRLGGTLPVAPVYDLVVKGVELVVATHGRSIWTLDDLTPFHRIHDLLRRRGATARPRAAPSSRRAAPSGDAPAHLFPPRPTVRFRVLGGIAGVEAQATGSRGRAWPGMVNYARSGASLVRVLPVKRPDEGYDTISLDSGQNPPNGVAIHYYLAAAPSGAVTLSILDARGRRLRTFTSGSDRVPARPGVNRFVWNGRLAGVPNVRASDLEPWNRPDGPMVVPGRYAVRLEVGGHREIEPFELLPDPRIEASAEALQEQFALLQGILARLWLVNATINDIDAMLEHLASAAATPGVRGRAGAKRRAELRAIRAALIDVNYRGAQLWPSGLHEKFNALFNTVDSGDRAPSRQARELFAMLSDQLDRLLRRWRAVRGREAR